MAGETCACEELIIVTKTFEQERIWKEEIVPGIISFLEFFSKNEIYMILTNIN